MSQIKLGPGQRNYSNLSVGNRNFVKHDQILCDEFDINQSEIG